MPRGRRRERHQVHVGLAPNYEDALTDVAVGVRVLQDVEQIATFDVEDDLFDGSVLRERMLEARVPAAQLDVLETALLEHARWNNARDREVEIACALVAEGVRIRTVSDRIGLTPRQLIARFRSRIGMSPKLFARIARFQRVIHAADSEMAWVEVAGRYGFADQAHLIREFRVFAGTTPTAYRARSVEARNHIPID
jgi:AraC-like DNA-binding protein